MEKDVLIVLLLLLGGAVCETMSYEDRFALDDSFRHGRIVYLIRSGLPVISRKTFLAFTKRNEGKGMFHPKSVYHGVRDVAFQFPH